MLDRAACPRPDKRTFATKAQAKLALRRWGVHDRGKLEAYRCACGSFHIGTKRAVIRAARAAA